MLRPGCWSNWKTKTRDYIRWRFKGSIEEARKLFTSAEFKDDMERMLWGEEYTIPGETGTWGSFCKTQFANEFGLPNFLRAHMTVCAILEKAQDLGFKVTVYDEGEFWTKRDVKALAETVGQWDQMHCRDVRRDEGCGTRGRSGIPNAEPSRFRASGNEGLAGGLWHRGGQDRGLPAQAEAALR